MERNILLRYVIVKLFNILYITLAKCNMPRIYIWCFQLAPVCSDTVLVGNGGIYIFFCYTAMRPFHNLRCYITLSNIHLFGKHTKSLKSFALPAQAGRLQWKTALQGDKVAILQHSLELHVAIEKPCGNRNLKMDIVLMNAL